MEDLQLCIHPGSLHISRHLQPTCQPLRNRLKERKIQETRAGEEEAAGVRGVAEALVEVQPWAPETLPPLRTGALAMTFARLPKGAFSVEVAREQADGTWLWAIDQLKLAPPKD